MEVNYGDFFARAERYPFEHSGSIFKNSPGINLIVYCGMDPCI
jgi:hypothetical protein